MTSVPFILGTTHNKLNHTNSSSEMVERMVNRRDFTARHCTSCVAAYALKSPVVSLAPTTVLIVVYPGDFHGYSMFAEGTRERIRKCLRISDLQTLG